MTLVYYKFLKVKSKPPNLPTAIFLMPSFFGFFGQKKSKRKKVKIRKCRKTPKLLTPINKISQHIFPGVRRPPKIWPVNIPACTVCWKKFKHFESNSKYSLYIACSKRNFTLMSKLGLFLVCDKNSGFWSEICDIFESYSYFSNILNKYITYFTPESRVFVAHQK